MSEAPATDADPDVEARDWALRHFVYGYIVEHGRPPTAAEAASALEIGKDGRVQAAYERLHRRHALFLDPANGSIRMAHPFSGVATSFRVTSNGRLY